MSVSAISDFSEDEIQSIRWGLDFRWRNQDIELHMADVEADLADGTSAPTEYPAVFWRIGDCNFIVFKTGEYGFRGQFFYEPSEQYGTHVPWSIRIQGVRGRPASNPGRPPQRASRRVPVGRRADPVAKRRT